MSSALADFPAKFPCLAMHLGVAEGKEPGQVSDDEWTSLATVLTPDTQVMFEAQEEPQQYIWLRLAQILRQASVVEKLRFVFGGDETACLDLTEVAWNINRCVLWKTFEQGKPIIERYIENFELSKKIRSSQELYSDDVQNNIRDFLRSFLERSAAIITGAQPMLWLPLDEKFIVIWEAALDPLVLETQAAVESKYANEKRFKTQLDAWMRDEQGWTISSKDEELIRENLERAAKFSCYVIANKILFYKALRRKFARMPALRIPANIVTGEQLREHLQNLFAEATKISKDYETVFASDFGDSLPALTDEAVDSWKLLNKETDAFDFTQINYEIIGQIFERMLSGDERHRFGQHYTRSDIVDLINSFCIRNAADSVLDPACGGGTFWVRAYDRKRFELTQQFLQLAAAHTADEHIQDRVVQELWKRSAGARRPSNPSSIQ